MTEENDLPACEASPRYGMIPPPGAPRCENRAEWAWHFDGCDCGLMKVYLCTIHHYRELQLEANHNTTYFICTHHVPNQKTRCVGKELLR